MRRRPGPVSTVLAMLALAGSMALPACGGDGDPASRVSSVSLTSALDTVIPVGFTTAVTAIGQDSDGDPVDVTFDWASSAEQVASVSGSGAVLGVADGRAVISATARESDLVAPGGATGTIPMRVVDADVDALRALLADPLAAHLVAALGPSQGAVADALDECDAGLSSGNLVRASGCIDAVRAALASATDGDDRALLATLSLLTDYTASALTF